MLLTKLQPKIKKEIVKGGLIMAPQRSGKTRAIAEVLHENPNFILVVARPAFLKAHQESYLELYGDKCPRIVTETEYKRLGRRNKNLKVILDDYLWNLKAGYYTNIDFHAAVSSPLKRTKIFKPTTEMKEELEQQGIDLKDDRIQRDFCVF